VLSLQKIMDGYETGVGLGQNWRACASPRSRPKTATDSLPFLFSFGSSTKTSGFLLRFFPAYPQPRVLEKLKKASKLMIK